MARNKTMIKINGSFIPDPSSLSWGQSDVSGSNAGRDQSGKMHKERITCKDKLELSWSNVTKSEASAILNAVSGEYFNVTYWSPIEGSVTKKMYVGDRSAPVQQWVSGKEIYTSVSFNVIEV